VSIGLALAAFALASYLRKEFGFLAVVGVLILLVIYEWPTVRVTASGGARAAIDA
jgi:4-hydroxybenzoate polyprenyltransferase